MHMGQMTLNKRAQGLQNAWAKHEAKQVHKNMLDGKGSCTCQKGMTVT